MGGTWAPASSVLIDVEGYRNNVSSLIDTRYQGVNAAGFQVYQNVNVAKAHTAGVELDLSYNRGALTTSVGYDFLRARNDETALPLGRRASHTARLHVARVFDLLSGVTTDFTGRYTGSAPMIGTVADLPAIVGTQGAFLALDAQVRANLTRLAEVSAGVNNLLDQRPAFYTAAYQRQYFVAVHFWWSRQPL